MNYYDTWIFNKGLHLFSNSEYRPTVGPLSDYNLSYIYCYTKHQLKNVVFYRVGHNKPEPPAYICGINNAKYVRKPTVFWKLQEHQYLIKQTVFFPSNSRCGDINHQSARVLQAGWPSRYPDKANQEPQQHGRRREEKNDVYTVSEFWLLRQTHLQHQQPTDILATFSFRSCRRF